MYEDGDLRIYSKAGKGTVVQIILPAAQGRGLSEDIKGERMLRLLIADDEMIERQVLYKTLQKNLGTGAGFSRQPTAGKPLRSMRKRRYRLPFWTSRCRA